MRVLITGATGLLGSDLCRLLRKDHQVTGWARRLPRREGWSVPLESVDVTDEKGVAKAGSRLRPQVVVHAAALSDVDVCERQETLAVEVNAKAVEKIARFCASLGAVLIAISTDYVFDGTLTRPYREEDPPHPLSVYGRSKLEAERVALGNLSRSLVVRVSGLFGSGRPNFVSTAVDNFRNGRAVQVVVDQRNSPSYAQDVSWGLGLLLKRLEGDPQEIFSDQGPGRILHLANAGGATRLEVAQRIAQCLGASESLIQRTTWGALNRPAQRPRNSRLDGRRFTQFFGLPLRAWEEALQAFVESSSLGAIELSG